MGGTDKTDLMMKDCEKFDVFNHRWQPMPKMNFERGNPGSYLSADKRYIYVFQGFINKLDENGARLLHKQSKALDSVERIDLWNETQGWEVLDIENESLTPKGCFVMHSLVSQADLNLNGGLEDKIMLFGGWKPYRNLSDIEVFDLKEKRIRGIGEFQKGLKITQQEDTGQMSASTAHESATSEGEEDEDSDVTLKFGDKFTKKPIQRGKHLILLGRMHLHLFNLETFSSKILLKVGED